MAEIVHELLIDNESVFNAEVSQKGTVMAFDFGEQRIGIAIGEHLIQAANPLATIDTESTSVRFDKITMLINEWKPNLLVVGYPLNTDGTEHAVTQLCKKFARRLNGRFNLPVVLVDERYSSIEASQKLNAQGIKGRAQKSKLDVMAAQIILQSYFNNL